MSEAHIAERLNYVFVLLRLMKDSDSDTDVKCALAGGASMWLGAVDKSLEAANPVIEGKTYKSRRTSEAGGRTLFGLRLSRNEIAHGEALVLKSGAEADFVFPMMFHLRFVPTDVLERLHSARPGTPLSEHHLKEYGQFVANQDPVVVFQRAYDWLRETTGV